ncbi:MAG: aspartate aminotransferase family protein [Alphaproteobacteria bacterium]|nr:aspartate aminotransferase family protein [Alphaproteobacteria bacterium]MDP6587853.1 aspartate aminotransferase family protein [Alphaproteobacteria bacterium]
MSTALVQNYARIDVAFERGEGAYLYADDGRRFLDFASGIGVTSLGHAHPRVTKALKDQADKVWHVSNLYNIDPQTRLAERLTAHSFADRAFFCNSGAEAVEASLKMARIHHSSTGAPERYRVVTVVNAFHGRTLATIAAGGQAKHLDGFGPRVDGFDQVALNDLDAAKAAVGPETAAILVEPVQGEGGIHIADKAFLAGLRALCDAAGILLIYDEIQCGMGRTGKLWAHEWPGVAPDIMAVAKALGNGFPIGAVLATEAAAETLVPGKHGTTFGGNPLAMSVANAVLDEMLADGFLAHAERMGALLRQRLEGLIGNKRVFSEVRGSGLMLGLQCTDSNLELMAELREQGLLSVVADGNVLRLLPPLIIGEAEIDEACAAVERACAAIES